LDEEFPPVFSYPFPSLKSEAKMEKIDIPYYYKSIDFEKLVKEYPPPGEFKETVYLWSREKIEKMQSERFKKIVHFAWINPFYRRIWKEAGIEPKDIRGIEDIRKLPVVTVFDFKAAIDAFPPFGDHQGITPEGAKKKPLKLQSSGGTTGKPRPTFFGPIEWEINGISSARALFIQGARPGDIMQIPTNASTANFAWCFYYACHAWLGVVPITSGSGIVTPTRRQIGLAREWGTNLWASFPEYMGHMGKVAIDELNFDVRDLRTKLIHTYLGSDLSGRLRRDLEEMWGCDVFDNYGTHEIGVPAFECREKAGLHFQEDLGYVEVVNPDTNEPVNTGERGDLVYTSFYRQHPPLIRYNLKDLIRIIHSNKRCSCGSWLLRMDHFLGRSDEMVKLRGTNVYPMACLDAVRADPRSTGEWICIVDRLGEGLDAKDEMIVKVECKDENMNMEDFKKRMEERLKLDIGVRVTVEPVPPGSLAPLTGYGSGQGKVKRLKDNRPKER
jgi:phenylacetate-CoA ligase